MVLFPEHWYVIVMESMGSFIRMTYNHLTEIDVHIKEHLAYEIYRRHDRRVKDLPGKVIRYP
jgi:hypothetical protein